MAVEKLLGIEVPAALQGPARACCASWPGISAHLLWLGTHALDVGAATVFFYTFQQREYLYDLIEELTGARLTTSTVRIGGMARDASPEWLEKVSKFIDDVMPQSYRRLRVALLTSQHGSGSSRTQGVGVRSTADVAVRHGHAPGRCCAPRASSTTCARPSPYS